MRKTLLCIAVAWLLGSAAASAAEFWEKKNYKTWSEKECRKLLQDSPWAKQHTEQSQVTLPDIPGGRPAGAISNDTADPENPPEEVADRVVESGARITYQAQFRSARPIRQARVRQAQLRQNYDAMTAQQKQAFDREADQFLGREFPDTVVVYVTYTASGRADPGALQQYWKSQSVETLKDKVFLSGSEGVKAPLMQFTPAEGDAPAFQFIFPRQVQERPLVGPGDKRLQLEFPHPGVSAGGERRIRMEFKVSKMVVGGQVVY